MQSSIPCPPKVKELFAVLLEQNNKTFTSLQVAFDVFVRSHDLPNDAQLLGVSDDGLLVKLPEPSSG